MESGEQKNAGADQGEPGAKGEAAKSGDPLQDMLQQQEDDAATANKSLEDALKAK